MLHVLLAILTATAVPTPSASPAPEGLKTIVTVKSSPFCSAFARHANAAIGSAVRNDATLSALVGSLRTNALGENAIVRSNEEQRLSNLADSIYRQYRSGMTEVNRLRDLVKTAPTDQEKAALKASADALGGALYRQHLIQRDLDGFVAFLSTADMRSLSPDDARNQASLTDPGLLGYTSSQTGPYPVWLPGGAQLVDPPQFPGDESRQDDVRMSLLASRDFASRLPDIIKDEMTAAAHFTDAGSSC